MAVISVNIVFLWSAITLFLLFTIIWSVRRLTAPATSGLRMCPFCGMITSSSKAACLECGKSPVRTNTK